MGSAGSYQGLLARGSASETQRWHHRPYLSGCLSHQGPGRAQYRPGSSELGLYIAREIIKRHGGTITIESEEGKGATFYMMLPCTR
jgi:Histidine kinase-, DNA gyrase B-, and HSP90-like ATPase